MNTHRHPLFVLASRGLSAALLLLAFAGSASAVIVAPNDPPDLSSAPPDLSQSVDPNILVTFDDSGSMASNFMGDNRPFDGSGWGGGTPENNPWFCSGVIDPRATSGVLTKSMNGVYYNPTVVYTPPLYQDGTPFPNADATLAGVVADGIAINRPAAANQQTAASATYMNNVNSDQNANDTRVAIINGKLETVAASTTSVTENCGPSRTCACSAQVSGGTVSNCACSTDSRSRNTCTWTDTYTIPATNTDKRWSCGSASNKNSSGNNTTGPYAGVNPHYPTAMVYADGTTVADADRWGPYYYRLKSSVALTTDSFGDPDSTSQTALYTASNWEAVLVTNTNVTIGTKTVNQWQNFANWYAYYRTRNLMTRTALSRVFGVLGQNIRVAWQNISPYDASTTTKSTAVAITSSTIITNLTNNNANAANYRTNFFNWIFQTPAYSATPDRAATIQAGAFFERVDAKDNSSGVPAGTAPHLTDPYYDPGVGHDLGCRQNFHMLVTDGYWNEGDPTTPTGFFTAKVGPTQTSGSTTTHNLPDGTAYSTTDTQTAVYWNTQGTSYDSSLANIGFYYWAHDLRPDLAPTATPTPYHSPVPIYVKDTKTGVTTGTGASNAAVNEEIYFNPANDPANWRHVVQFMVTLGVAGNLNYSSDGDCVDPSNDFCHLRKNTANSSGAVGWPRPANNSPPAIDDTWHAAVNSRGSYFSASNPANLVAHLSEIIDSIIARSGQSTAESVSTSILNQGAVGFQGGYNSSGWTGYLYKQTLNTTTGAVLSQVWDAGCYLTGSICAATGGTGTAAD